MSVAPLVETCAASSDIIAIVLDPKESGAVIPVVHANGFKISERTLLGSMDDREVVTLFTGYVRCPTFLVVVRADRAPQGYLPCIVEYDDLSNPTPEADRKVQKCVHVTTNARLPADSAQGYVRRNGMGVSRDQDDPARRPQRKPPNEASVAHVSRSCVVRGVTTTLNDPMQDLYADTERMDRATQRRQQPDGQLVSIS